MGEARLVEILESHTCKSNKEKCYEFLSDHEEDIEEWWSELGDGDVAGLEAHLCIETSKVCCAAGTWGPTCSPCPGGSKDPCSGHGSCSGDGVRSGKGKCSCKDGWGGKKCNKCSAGFFLAATPSEESGGDIQSCRKCDAACDGCLGPGAQGCDKCAAGYAKDRDGPGPCVEVDECAAEVNPCDERSSVAVKAGKQALFCLNTPGSYKCQDCHAACSVPDEAAGAGVCSGPAATDCSAGCNAGYQAADGGGCEDVDECAAGHACDAGSLCQNKDGGVECAACDPACSKEGCTSLGSSGCISCKSGYKLTGSACENIDECKEFPCKGAEDCVDTDSSYECSCNGPNKSDPVDGLCIRPEKYRGMMVLSDEAVAVQAARKLALPDPAAGVKSGSAEIGGSDLSARGVKVDFPAGLFDAPPALSKLQGKGICCGDTFNFSYSGLTEAGFTVLATRSDTQSGWGQTFKVDWEVVDSNAKILETRTAELIRPAAEEGLESSAGGGGLGLEIVEDFQSNGDSNGVRLRVKPGGVADATGKVKDGDKVLSVNGAPLRSASYETVLEKLQTPGTITLVVTPDASPLPAITDKVKEDAPPAAATPKDEL